MEAFEKYKEIELIRLRLTRSKQLIRAGTRQKSEIIPSFLLE